MPYMVEHDYKVVGPYSLEELGQHIANNTLAPTDRACDQNSSLWLPISQILAPRPRLVAIASSAPGTPFFKGGVGAAAGVGGGILTALLFLWRAIRVINLLTHAHHP